MHHLFCFVSLSMYILAGSIPITENSNQSAKVARQFAIDYLYKNGYLSTDIPSELALLDSLRVFQRSKNLRETGELDIFTLGAMHEYRCGYDDVNKALKDSAGDTTSGTKFSDEKGFDEKRGNFISGNKDTREGRRRQRRRRRNRNINFRTRWWFICDLTWGVRGSPPRGWTIDDLRSIMKNVLDIWQTGINVNGSILTFRESDAPRPDLILEYQRGRHGDGAPFDGPGNTLAHAALPYISGRHDGELHVDKAEDWRPKTVWGKLMEYTILHEAGHLLGLQHSRNFNSVMFPFIGRRHIARGLELDDIDKTHIRSKYRIRWCDNLDLVPVRIRPVDRVRINRENSRNVTVSTRSK